jgi:predicted restriction endonuclease
MTKKRYSRQQIRKLFEKKCYFCGEDNYDLLDAHRIIPGEQGGKYNDHNILVICSNCHRKCHAGIIKIDRKYMSTTGRWVLHYWIDGEEKWA